MFGASAWSSDPNADVSERQRRSRFRVRLTLAIIGVAVLYGGALVSLTFRANFAAQLTIIAGAVTVGLGVLVGVSELIARYTDAPGTALMTGPALFYIGVNGVAAAIAFAVVDGYNLLNFKPEADLFARLSSEAVLAGLGAMAFFRAAVFNVRVGNTDIAVGPASILQIILKAVDRACDRDRAEPRALLASQLMTGVSFQQAADVLPQFCFDSMQNVSPEESQRFLEWVELLKKKEIDDEQKTLLLGLRLLNIVGERVLRSTIRGLGGRIRADLRIGLETLGMLRLVDFERAHNALVALCRALALGQIDDWSNVRLEEAIKAIQQGNYDNDVKVLLLASELIRLFGESILEKALELGGPSLHASPPTVTGPTTPDCNPKDPP